MKTNSPVAVSWTQATLLYLPKSTARMVFVDAFVAFAVFAAAFVRIVFIMASLPWGLWGLFAW